MAWSNGVIAVLWRWDAACFLTSTFLPPFWVEAINYSCFIQNRIPCAANPTTTPETLLSGTTPDLSKLREFGTSVHIHIPTARCDKLSSKSLPCIFCGINETSSLFWCYDPMTRIIHLSRDVRFHEQGPISLPAAPVVIESSFIFSLPDPVSAPSPVTILDPLAASFPLDIPLSPLGRSISPTQTEPPIPL
jgi:hypothetical protein